MEENNNQKISFFTRLKWAIFNLENYDFFAVEKTKYAIFYFAKLILIFSLITAIGVTYKFATTDLSKVEEIQEVVTQETIEYIQNMPKSELYAIFYMISVLYLFVIYFIATAVDALLLSILGILTSKIARISLRYLPIVNISIYALTLSIILNVVYILINAFTGFEIKYFQIMYNTIAYIYLVTAIFMIKSEMIKQEAELSKLAEEQQKIREQLEKDQEEERQKQEQKRKEREEKKKDKEKDKKEKNEDEGGAYEGQA